MKSSAFWKILKNPLGAVSIGLIVLFVVISILGYIITPDSSPSSNTMNLAMANAPMGTEVLMLYSQSESCSESSALEMWFFGDACPTRITPVAEVSSDGGMYREYLGPGEEQGEWTEIVEGQYIQEYTYLLGADKYGRDLLSRLILGGRVSIAVGFISVFISLLIGVPLGAAAGYFGGWVDKSVMWLVNVVWSIPTLLMVIALTFVLGKGFWQVFVAVGLTMWVEVARVVRGQVMGLRKMEFVEAAKVLGFSSSRIIWKHILPNAWAPVIVISAANFASAILMESGLSFLGIGAQPPIPSWGGIIRDHYAYIITGEAHLSVLPGLCIMLLVLSFMVLGNTLRDALDVRSA
ncbi:ABC transporter permease [Phaeocystidibacter marisrubri]|uniref:ABC transporter permease n=1 Tax=Phaeocystidibacter marisrubri TaxID=1577780 RepID=A0A6L3ZE07_9FLAO|nr:ABC transporter permease [Phaeocystidibacter marisrubri]KAB2816065.1 ABC transporter permease [Phaeocystidibacter marisrubri]GGH67160.1 hypothetical protein GCM10011318_05840 [Phaeocystidibacter marisrubri]